MGSPAAPPVIIVVLCIPAAQSPPPTNPPPPPAGVSPCLRAGGRAQTGARGTWWATSLLAEGSPLPMPKIIPPARRPPPITPAQRHAPAPTHSLGVGLKVGAALVPLDLGRLGVRGRKRMRAGPWLASHQAATTGVALQAPWAHQAGAGSTTRMPGQQQQPPASPPSARTACAHPPRCRAGRPPCRPQRQTPGARCSGGSSHPRGTGTRSRLRACARVCVSG